MRWLVFPAAGFAQVVAATELDIDYLPRFHSPSELTA